MDDAPRRHLGGLSAREFLSEYWQKKPLLVRAAFPHDHLPLAPEELAGIAMEEEAASRIVLSKGDGSWELRHGPFVEEDFARLPEAGWTLLVQETEQWHPGPAELVASFRFIPNWRVDDLMISFAAPGGGVGAHIDNYDVFLIQTLGRRRWRIATVPVQSENLVPDVDVRILADFEPDEDWTLDPGDMLYLPPKIAHEGIALDNCMTCSVGFRAPSTSELISAYLQDLVETLADDPRFADPDRIPAAEPGLMDEESIVRLRAMIMEPIADLGRYRSWLGRFLTEPKRGRHPEEPDEFYQPSELLEVLEQGGELRRTSVGQFAYMTNEDRTTSLFVGGEQFRLEADLGQAARLITGAERLTADTVGPYAAEPAILTLLTELANSGYLIPETTSE